MTIEKGYRQPVLDHGYVQLVDFMGEDKDVILAARMSTAKGFLGWGPKCSTCGHARDEAIGPDDTSDSEPCPACHDQVPTEQGDEKLLKFLWDHEHSSPFEFTEMVVEVKAPLFIFAEWQRHRTQSYAQMSSRYVPLPDENYLPTRDRVTSSSAPSANKQARGTSNKQCTEVDAIEWLAELADYYEHGQRVYESGLRRGVAKELARLSVPVARYSVMRAKTDMLNWLKFLKLRCAPVAQWEFRQHSQIVAHMLAATFPRTYAVARESMRLPPAP